MKAKIILEDDGKKGLSFDILPVESQEDPVAQSIASINAYYRRIELKCERISDEIKKLQKSIDK